MVEADFSRTNMDRYAAQRARAVGGPHGRRHFIQPFDPPAQLIFFDDWTVIKRSSPFSNFHSDTGPTTQKIEDKVTRDEGEIQTQDQVQLIMKAEADFDGIQSLVVPFALARHNSTFGGDPFTLRISEVIVQATFLKVSLTDGGQFDLKNVTWNDANKRPQWDQSTPLSPLFSTPDNIEEVTAALLLAQGIPIPDGTDNVSSSDTSWGGGVVDPSGVPAASLFVRLVNGPYTGIMLIMNSGFQGGQQNLNADSAFEEAEVEEIRPVHFIQNDQRPYLVTAQFNTVFNQVQ